MDQGGIVVGRRGSQTGMVLVVVRGDGKIEVGSMSPARRGIILPNRQRIKMLHKEFAMQLPCTCCWTTLLVMHNHVDAPRPINPSTAHHLSAGGPSYLDIARQIRHLGRMANRRVYGQEAAGAVIGLRGLLPPSGP